MRRSGDHAGRNGLLRVVRTCHHRSPPDMLAPLSPAFSALGRYPSSRLLLSLNVNNLRAKLSLRFKHSMTTLEKLSSNKAFGGELTKYKFKAGLVEPARPAPS